VSADTVAAIGALIYANRDLLPVLEEHLAENEGEVLPTIVLDDAVRWLVEYRASHLDVCRSVFAWLEQELVEGSEAVRALITVSGIVMIPDPGQPGAELRDLLGPRLREVDPWLA
jgi:hypothetical protein